jgi:hypothetical protein
MNNTKLTPFDVWLFKVVERLSKGVRDPTDIFVRIDLYDAKLAFIDGVSPNDYNPF